MILSCLFMEETAGKGRGMYTDEAIPADTVIEIAPVIAMPKEDRPHLDKTLLHDYIFEWGEKKDECCMALGMIPIYNHRSPSNCDYYMDYETKLMMVKTVRHIEAGEELTINYNGDWDNGKDVWFETMNS